jgi:hypothetical protein
VSGLIEVFRQTGTAAVIDRRVKLKSRKRGLSAAEMVESLLALWPAGGERTEDLDRFRQDKALALLLGHDLPAAQTALDFLAQFHAEDLPLLQEGKAKVAAESVLRTAPQPHRPPRTARLAPEPQPLLPDLTAPVTPGFVYVLGTVQPRFPSLGVEKEFVQATGRAPTAGLTDRAALKAVLSERQNRYLVRELCWVLTVEDLETYLLRPRDPADFDLLLDALRATPRAGDLDVVIGTRGPLAPPEACNGLLVPMLAFKQIYSFDVDSFVKAIPRPQTVPKVEFTPAAEEVLGRIMPMTDNAGTTDQHRALNCLVTRYPAIYATTAEAHRRGSGLSAIEARPSRLNGIGRILDVVFTFTHRQTDVTDRYFNCVDVTRSSRSW